jgi:hypothetical protein
VFHRSWLIGSFLGSQAAFFQLTFNLKQSEIQATTPLGLFGPARSERHPFHLLVVFVAQFFEVTIAFQQLLVGFVGHRYPARI